MGSPERTLSRRKLLAGLGTSFAAAGTGVLGGASSRATPTEVGIEVALFTTESQVEMARRTSAGAGDPFRAARLVRELLSLAVPLLSTGEISVVPEVTVETTPVPDSVHGDTVEETNAAFGAYLVGERFGDVAEHSNLLLTTGGGATGETGTATVRPRTGPASPVQCGVFVDAMQLHRADIRSDGVRPYRGHHKNLLTPVHEVGHNLGFHHRDAHATADPRWAKEHIPPSDHAADWSVGHEGDRSTLYDPAGSRDPRTETPGSGPADPGRDGGPPSRPTPGGPDGPDSPGDRWSTADVYATVMANSYADELEGTVNNFGERWPEVGTRPTGILPAFNPELSADHLR